jgi:glutathione S-transferase
LIVIQVEPEPERTDDLTASLRLYDYAASANCYKVRLLLAQLGVPYERVEVDIFAGATLDPSFGAINPARETPVLAVDDRYLPESGAILAYLADGTDFMPDDRWTRAEVLRWMLFEQTQVMATIGGLRFRTLTGRLDPTHPGATRRREACHAALAILDRHLAERTFLAGDRYTIADIAVYGYAHVAGDAGIALSDYPGVTRWLNAVRGAPGFVNDLAPYPDNARPGVSRSIYDDAGSA